MTYDIILHLRSVRGVMMERWNGIGGNELSRLLTNSRYPRRPNQARKLPRLVSPVNKGNNYGLRLRTYFRVGILLDLIKHVFKNVSVVGKIGVQ